MWYSQLVTKVQQNPDSHNPTAPHFAKIHPKSHFTKKGSFWAALFCDPPGIRTQDPNIKSVVLCQLS